MKEKELIEEKLSRGEPLCITVIGLGYVGLPIAVAFAERNHRVFGVDINEDRLKRLKAGQATSDDGVSGQSVRDVIEAEKLLLRHVPRDPKRATPEQLGLLADLSESHVFVVCVHTPLTAGTREPNTKWIVRSCDLLELVYRYSEEKGELSGERLVVLESTTYPGTTRDVFVERLRAFDRDGTFRSLFAYSPERANPGQAYVATERDEPIKPEDVPRVVGGADGRSLAAALRFYSEILNHPVPVENTDTAEMVKLVENSFRNVAIAFANEMSLVAKAMGLDGHAVFEAVLTKPYGLDMCVPGLIGGHCLPVDPTFLSWKAKKLGVRARFIELAEDIHRKMDNEAVELIRRMFDVRGEDLSRAHLLFLGVSYKENVADIRESGVLRLMRQVVLLGARVTFWDPNWNQVFLEDDLRVRLAEQSVSPDILEKVRVKTYYDQEERPYCLPICFRSDEAEIERNILGGEFDAIVFGVRHSAFDNMLETLVCADVPIVDVCNGIRNWLARQSDTRTKTGLASGDIRARLSDPRKYALLGTN